MLNDDKALRTLLNTDALLEAEKLTGKSYKEDEATEGIGLLMHMQLAQQKSTALANAGDSTFSMDWEAYCDLVLSAGFRRVASHQRTVDNYGSPMHRHFALFWHDDGLLLDADSHTMCEKVDRNSATMTFNWKPSGETFPYMKWSGGFTDGVLIADVDAREALLLTLREYRSFGAFVKPWRKRPFHVDYGVYDKWLEVPDQEAQLKADLPAAIYAAIAPAATEPKA